MKKVFIILVNYNGYKDTINCIESIKKNLDLKRYFIVVVDNCSTDESCKYIEKINNIKFLKSMENKGFSAGNNIGIKYALKENADYIILLNNDTIVTKNCFDKIIEIMENKKDIGIMGNKVLYYSDKNKINCYGGDINFNRGTAILGYENSLDNDSIPDFIDAKFICGCCMVIRKEVFEKIGYLPEDYFMYYEDVDFCLNVSRHFKLAAYGKSKIYHKVSASTGGQASEFAIRWNTRNRIVFINKYCKKYPAKLFFYLTRIIVIIKYILRGRFKLCQAMCLGIKDGWRCINENKKI